MISRLFLVVSLFLCYGLVAGYYQNASPQTDQIVQEALLKKEVCFKELGCFKITSDFVSIKNRPINVLPNDPAIINTKFLLYTKKNAKESRQLTANKNSIEDSNFNPNNPVKFIIHGFMDSEVFGPWMTKLKDEFLLHGDYNIIIVDWSGGNKPPYYQATANTRVVGVEVALFIEALMKNFGIKAEDCHLIGHSLGSHISGYAGEKLQKKLGRITGLDPAEPYFQNMPATVRLDKTDAKFVDVIHSDSKSMLLFGFGMSQLVGHIDFFPNNGRDQPGCKKDRFTKFLIDGLTEGMRRFVSCNHQRSVDFFHHSINYINSPPVAYECEDYDSYLNGQCSDCGKDLSKCALMGIRADEYPKRTGSDKAFYVKTTGSSPFWLYHYQVTVKLFKPKGKVDDPKGNFEVNLHGSTEDYLAKLEPKEPSLVHGTKMQFLVTSDKELGDIKSVTFKWFSSSKNPLKLLIKPKLYVQYVTVMPMNIVEKSPRSTKGRLFCAKPEKEITPKVITTLSKSDNCNVKD